MIVKVARTRYHKVFRRQHIEQRVVVAGRASILPLCLHIVLVVVVAVRLLIRRRRCVVCVIHIINITLNTQ